MRTAECHRPRIGKRLAGWTAILALVVQMALPAIMLAAAKAGASGYRSPAAIVVCTADGLERVARTDDESAPVSGAQTPCPICLAAQGPMVVPSEVGEHVVGALASQRCETMPRPPCRVVVSPPARAPPQSA